MSLKLLNIAVEEIRSRMSENDSFVYQIQNKSLNRHVILSTTPRIPTLKPALSTKVEINITVVYTITFTVIFLFVYIQLWMIWYYRHKRTSYQTAFLFCSLFWSGLRTTLFSFYFNDCASANNLPLFWYWLLFCFPVCLQFVMLCLMILFFAQVVLKARARFEPTRYKTVLHLVIFCAILVFNLSNLVSAIILRLHEKYSRSIPWFYFYIRVAINDSLFVIGAISLSILIVNVTKNSSSSLVFRSKGMSMCQAVVVSLLMVTLFLSRAVYNFITITPNIRNKLPGFGYDWINVSDQVDAVKNLPHSFAYISFGIVLLIWEVLPISVVVVLFRVKRQTLSEMSSSSNGSKVFFFDNPHRYDSNENLSATTNWPGNNIQRCCGCQGYTGRLGDSLSVAGHSLPAPSYGSMPHGPLPSANDEQANRPRIDNCQASSGIQFAPGHDYHVTSDNNHGPLLE